MTNEAEIDRRTAEDAVEDHGGFARSSRPTQATRQVGRRNRWHVLVRSAMLAVLPLLVGCDFGLGVAQIYAEAVVQNIGFGIRDCVSEAGLSGCLEGGDPVELITGALINGALFGVQ